MTTPTKSILFSGINDYTSFGNTINFREHGVFKLEVKPRWGYFRVTLSSETLSWGCDFIGTYEEAKKFAIQAAYMHNMDYIFEGHDSKFNVLANWIKMKWNRYTYSKKEKTK